MVKSISALLRLGLSPRVLGFDDAPFNTRPRVPNANVNFVGIMTSADRFEGMLYRDGLLQDGLNGGSSIARAVTGSKFHDQIHAVFIDGITMGGLNVIDIETLADDIMRPVISVMRRPPNVASMMEACSKLPEYEERTRRIRAAGPIHESGGWIFQFRCPSGTEDAPSVDEVARLLQRCTPGEEQKIPECLRLAHLIGAAVKTGQSSSNA